MRTNPYDPPTSDIGSPLTEVLSRRQLVPRWIKVFGWLFIVVAILTIPLMLWAVVAGEPVNFQLFGINYTGPAMNPYAFGMQGLYLFMGVTAFGLLFGKDWGLLGAMANGYLGLVICILTMVFSGFTNIRVEPIIQLFYLRRLHKIQDQWAEAKP